MHLIDTIDNIILSECFKSNVLLSEQDEDCNSGSEELSGELDNPKVCRHWGKTGHFCMPGRAPDT